MKAISFLGTSEYAEVTYIYNDREFRTDLFPEALFHFFPDLELIYLFATPTVQAHSNLQRLRERVQSKGKRLEVVPIPEGRSEDELWEIFSGLTGTVAEGEKVVFDITHSFRSIPFLTFLAAAYLRAARRVTIRAVIYGAYEARPKGDPSPRPVFDLTPFVFLLDWLAATNQFIHTGDAQYLARLLVREGKNRGSGALKNAGQELEDFSRAMMLCRPLEVMEKAGRVSAVLRKVSGEFHRWARPFEVMAGRIQEEYGRYALPRPRESVQESLRRQLDLIRWYAGHGQIIQAVTLAREWMVTAVGWRLFGKFALSLEERGGIEHGLSGLSRVAQKRSAPDELNEEGRELQRWPEAAALSDLWNQLTAVRNDLDHAGMNPSPMSATKLARKAKEEILPALEALARQWGLMEGAE
ncbi:MAG: TIGR02221 family CRISPR-associated protein [Thermoflexus sp.]